VGPKDPPLPSGSDCACRCDTLSCGSAAARWRAAGPHTTERCRTAAREDSWCAHIRVAEPEWAQRKFHVCGDAESVRAASLLDGTAPCKERLGRTFRQYANSNDAMRRYADSRFHRSIHL